MGFDLRFAKAGGTLVRRRVEGERLRIGRGTNNELRFDDARVGLEHATISRQGGRFVLEDRDSVTGTWVGGERVQRKRLTEGDVVEIGGRRIAVSLSPGGADLGLAVEASGEKARRAAGGADDDAPRRRTGGGRAAEGGRRRRPRQVDYAAAYRLDRAVARRWLTVGAAAATLVALAALVAAGRTAAFRPGPVSAAHASAVGPSSCNACHVPFAGPADARCAGCHAGHAVHQATQASTPACGGCHFEHRGLASLTVVPDGRCVDCHGDLELTAGASPTFASSVTGFAAGHPDFSVVLDGRRLPLGEASGADPTALAFGHVGHLRPLVTPEGRVQLACRDCHEGAAGQAAREGRMAPVVYERHCASCHPLTFDPALPAEQAPHESPAVVRAYVLAAYAGDARWRGLSFAERRRLIATDPDRDRSFRLGEGERRAANRAEGYLFQTACPECHLLERGPGALPEVAPVETSWDRLPHAWFPHPRHGPSQGLACSDCHAAAASPRAADVLIPGIEVCRSCHGGGGAAVDDEEAGEVSVASGSEAVDGLRRRPAIASACVDCHDFHAPEDDPATRLATGTTRRGASR